MPLSVLSMGKQVAVSADGSEAYQQADDDLGRLVQWTLGSPQERWEVRFIFTHVFGTNGGTVLGLGFGTKDVRLEEVDILADEKLVVCDAYDGEVNVLGEQSAPEGLDLSEPTTFASEEESIVAIYDAPRGFVRFHVTSPRCKGSAVAEIVRDSLKNLELYPTVAFANKRSKVRVEVQNALMAMPTPMSERLLRMDYSAYLGDATGPSGKVIFKVEGRELQADRFLLSARSEYFQGMLSAGLCESSSPSVVPIPDSSYAAFEAVLRFIYSAGQAREALFEEADPLEVLHLSIEFLLEDLTRLCEWRLMQCLCAENALATFGAVASVRNRVPVLAEACVERLHGRMHELCSTREFRELCRREDVVSELLLALDEPNAKRRRLVASAGPPSGHGQSARAAAPSRVAVSNSG